MGKYLDRLRARNFADSYGNEPSKPSKAPFESFEGYLPQENAKNSGGKKEENFLQYPKTGTAKTVKSPRRVTLAEYGAILNEAVTGADLPPIPPYRLGDREHEAAWSAWWDAVELQRAHRRAAP